MEDPKKLTDIKLQLAPIGISEIGILFIQFAHNYKRSSFRVENLTQSYAVEILLKMDEIINRFGKDKKVILDFLQLNQADFEDKYPHLSWSSISSKSASKQKITESIFELAVLNSIDPLLIQTDMISDEELDKFAILYPVTIELIREIKSKATTGSQFEVTQHNWNSLYSDIKVAGYKEIQMKSYNSAELYEACIHNLQRYCQHIPGIHLNYFTELARAIGIEDEENGFLQES